MTPTNVACAGYLALYLWFAMLKASISDFKPKSSGNIVFYGEFRAVESF